MEAVLYLKHGHLAISGSSSNHKLVICSLGELQPVAEFSDHTSTITGLLEFNNRLISCGIDKNIVVYDIIATKKAPKMSQSNSLWSCFISGSKKQGQSGEAEVTYSYTKQNVILNAHTSQINCISKLNDTYFATGAMKEIKIWRLFECVQVLATAH